MKKRYLKFFFPILIVLILELVLFKTNYLPGTWLVGWDTTQPELNFKAHLIRGISSLWQEYRGLGLVDGMAHGANLVHWVYIWLLNLILPAHLIRWAFVFLMHGLGVLGAYWLINHLIKFPPQGWNPIATSGSATLISPRGEPLLAPGVKVLSLPALVGALFYGLNPGTIQIFYLPFELFAVHFGFIPWLFLAAYKYLKEGRRKNLIIFFLLNFLSLSQAHVPTIFIVFILCLFGLMAVASILKSTSWRRVLAITLVVFGVNSFWALPYAYSILKAAPIIVQTKTNRLANPEIVLRNQAFGDLKSTSRLLGFGLDYEDWQKDQGLRFDFQLRVWQDHWQKPIVTFIGYSFFGLAFFGVLKVLWQKDKKLLPFVFLFLFSFINLGSQIPGIKFLRSLLNYLPYYQEAFRFAFTKFIFVYGLSLAVFLSVGVEKLSLPGFFNNPGSLSLSKRASNYQKRKVLRSLPAFFLIGAIFYQSRPSFSGDFIYPELKLKIPREYFEVFDFFNQPGRNGRVALLPQPHFWNWEFNRWGYRGSGFIWQGIKNPTLHRAFDPWSLESQTYYQQLSRVIYQEDLEGLEKVFEKYQVAWVVLDESVFQPDGWPQALFCEETKELLERSLEISRVAKFGFLAIYQVDNSRQMENFVFAPSEFFRVGNDLINSRQDLIFEENGFYISEFPEIQTEIYPGSESDWHSREEEDSGLIYPFADLLKDGARKDLFQEEFLILTSHLPAKEDYWLEVPIWEQKESFVPVDIFGLFEENDKIRLRFVTLLPRLRIDDQSWSRDWERELIVLLESDFEGNLLISLNGKEAALLLKGKSEQHLGSLLWPIEDRLKIKLYQAEPILGQQPIIDKDLKLPADFLPAGVRIKVQGKDLKVEIPLGAEEGLILNEDWLQDRGQKKGKNCDLFGRGEAGRIISPEAIIYQAVDKGSSCDYFVYSGFKESSGYVFRFIGENEGGRSLRFRLNNHDTRHNDLEEMLPAGSFDESFTVLPETNSLGSYDLVLETRSFGPEKAENRLSAIEIAPLPLNWLSGLKLVPQNGSYRQINGIKIKKVKKIGTFFYLVDVEVNDDQSLLGLSQAYAEGWEGYELEAQSSKIKTILPFIFGKKLAHVKINSWENGWLINNRGYFQMVLFFWPQLLSFAGIGGFVLTGLILFFYRRQDR
ncbi:MAG: hypothetical protein JW991_01325 [Candidatus Pacebacteria bacterium]|nr:hypothetical protein [Candidatus Paceibacterota bacterium]